jgi:hypothetical protein
MRPAIRFAAQTQLAGVLALAVAAASVGAGGCIARGVLLSARDGGGDEVGGPSAEAGGDARAPAGDDGDRPGDTGVDDTGDAGDAGADTIPGVFAPRPFNLSIGLDPLVDAFPTPAGIIVVRRAHIELVSRDGERLGLVTSPREITAAAFSGGRLTVADRGVVTFYAADLTVLGTARLQEACRSGAMLPSGTFVCPPTDEFQTFFWSYALGHAEGWKQSPGPFLSHVTERLVAVPGRDLLVGKSGYGFALYGASGDGVVTPWAGPIGASPGAIAFDGDPARRAVLEIGSSVFVFEIAPAGCGPETPDNCLRLDGDFIDVSTGDFLLALADGRAGAVQVLRGNSLGADVTCRQGCAFQTIDVATRAVTRSKVFRLMVGDGINSGAVVSARHDDVTDGMVLAYRSVDGERVDLLDYSSRAQPPGPLGPDASAGPAPLPPPPDSPVSGCTPSITLMDTPTRVVGAFPVAAGAVIARADGAMLVDRQGAMRALVPRPFSSDVQLAAMDEGGRLVLAGENGMFLYDADLRPLRAIPVQGGCYSMTVVRGGRALCATYLEIEGVTRLSSWALDSGTLLASVDGDLAFSPGVGLRAIPGEDAAVDAGFYYSLYLVAGDGTPSFVNRSVLGGTAGADFALHQGRADASGLPPTRLVTSSGTMLRVFGDGCLTIPGPFQSGCFLKDGEVGTLWGSQVFAALADDGRRSGDLYVLTADFPARPDAAAGDKVFRVQRIDVAGHRVISSRTTNLPFYTVKSAAVDTQCGMLLVAYAVGGPDTVPDPLISFRVDLLDYGKP